MLTRFFLEVHYIAAQVRPGVLYMNILFHTIRERVRGIRKPLKVLFIFGWIVLSFILLQIGIANSHRMGESEQQAVTALERLVVGIGEDGTVRLVTATLGDQVRSVDRYPLESGVTDLPDSLPVTEQTRIRYPWAVAVSQGKLFVFDLRSIVAEKHTLSSGLRSSKTVYCLCGWRNRLDRHRGFLGWHPSSTD